jgi:hypothetical protein
MSVHISLWGVLVSAISAMIIGTIWYSPAVFGKQWMKIIGLTDKDMKKSVNAVMTMMVVVSLLTAYVMAHFIVYTHAYAGGSWVSAGIQTALWAWLGISLTTILAHGLFEPRDKKVLYINAGNRLVTLLAMGLIIGLFMK